MDIINEIYSKIENGIITSIQSEQKESTTNNEDILVCPHCSKELEEFYRYTKQVSTERCIYTIKSEKKDNIPVYENDQSFDYVDSYPVDSEEYNCPDCHNDITEFINTANIELE